MVLMDCHGLSPFGFPIHTMRSCAALLQDHYPNRLGCLMIIRLPQLARVVTQTLFQVSSILRAWMNSCSLAALILRHPTHPPFSSCPPFRWVFWLLLSFFNSPTIEIYVYGVGEDVLAMFPRTCKFVRPFIHYGTELIPVFCCSYLMFFWVTFKPQSEPYILYSLFLIHHVILSFSVGMVVALWGFRTFYS